MAKISLTPALRKEYEDLFNTCVIKPARMAEVETTIGRLLAKRTVYQGVGGPLGIPWFIIAVIHNMEASLDFSSHLHNGDPLTARTVQVPAGRPKKGNPPFSWEESASDALTMRGLGSATDWSLAGTLYQMEGYNGWGYRLKHQHVKSPYLWSYSNHYTSGKFVKDGVWSDSAVSKQCGAAVILRRMSESGQIEFADQPAPKADTPPLVVSYSMKKSGDPAQVARAETLQQWLNTFPGIFVKVDGVPGERTSNAFKSVTGVYLPGDPRG
jgi:lysozyme family protein